MKEIETYRDLLAALQQLTPGQLDQRVQIADPPCDGKPVPMAQGIAIGTVGEFEFEGSRSVVDNCFHADEVVVLIDGNPHAEDGATAYKLETTKTSGKPIIRHIPIYGPGGPTPREAQRKSGKGKEFPDYLVRQCKTRTKSLNEKRAEEEML